MTRPMAASYIIADFSGEYFCQDPALALDSNQIEKCMKYLQDFMPRALELLFNIPDEATARSNCQYFYDQC